MNFDDLVKILGQTWVFFLWLLPLSRGFQNPPWPMRLIHIIQMDAVAASREYHMNHLEYSHPPLKVGIAGAGSIAFGTASLLASLGHDPMLWSPSGRGTQDLLETSIDGQSISYKIRSTRALEQTFDVRVACNCKELVVSNDNVLVIALPVNGHKRVMEALAPEIVQYANQLHSPDEGHKTIMHIIISSHASLGAVYLMNLLKEEQLKFMAKNNIGTELAKLDWIRITCWGTTAITARKLSGTSVKVLTIRQAIDFCTVPSAPSNNLNDAIDPDAADPQRELLCNGYALCNFLFGPRFIHRKGGLLAISLSNLNPQNHLGIVLGNMSRMDPPPPPPPIDSEIPPVIPIEPWYQGKCITPNVGRLLEALDRERISIAEALNIEVRNIHQHFSWSFHVPLETKDNAGAKTRPLTVSEMNQQMHYYNGNDVLGPSEPDSRYVLEDVPYGLVLTVLLGRIACRPALLHESGIMILSAMYGRDFMNENDLLQGLGLIGSGDIIPRTLNDWREMAYTGSFYDKESHKQLSRDTPL